MNPIVEKTFLRSCGDNIAIPSTLALSFRNCRASPGVFCSSSTPGLRTNENDDVNMDSPNEGQSSQGCLNEACAVDKRQTSSKSYIMVINEFDPKKSQRPDTTELIEIRITSTSTNKQIPEAFGAVKVVAFTLYTKQLVLVVNLYHQRIPPSGFYVIQSSDETTAKEFVQVASDKGDFKLLPDGTEAPIVVLLLEKEGVDVSWDSIQLIRNHRTKRRKSVDMSLTAKSSMIETMGKWRKDAVLYGTLKNQGIPEEGISILPLSFTGCNFIIPIGDVSSNQDMSSSINLCIPDGQSLQPFQYQYFKLGVPSA